MNNIKRAYAEPLRVAPTCFSDREKVCLTNLSGSFYQLIDVYEPYVQTPPLSYQPTSMSEWRVPRW